MMPPVPANRPFEGQALKDILADLAEISQVASGLSDELNPLLPEYIAAGAEPLTLPQIREALEQIQQLAFTIARMRLQATSEEWNKAGFEE